MKKYSRAVRSTKNVFDRNSALQAACDTSIACVTGCVCPRQGYRSVTPLLMPWSTGLGRLCHITFSFLSFFPSCFKRNGLVSWLVCILFVAGSLHGQRPNHRAVFPLCISCLVVFELRARLFRSEVWNLGSNAQPYQTILRCCTSLVIGVPKMRSRFTALRNSEDKACALRRGG